MAKKVTVKPKGKEGKPVPKGFEKEEYEFDVATLAKDLDILPASVRVALRKANVEKAGKSYGWNSRKDYDAVLKQLKSASEKAPVGKGKGKDADKDSGKKKPPKAKVKAKNSKSKDKDKDAGDGEEGGEGGEE